MVEDDGIEEEKVPDPVRVRVRKVSGARREVYCRQSMEPCDFFCRPKQVFFQGGEGICVLGLSGGLRQETH